jgi:hypothetical protein
LYQNRPGIKIYLINMLFVFGRIYYEAGDLKNSIKFLEELIPLVDEELELVMDIPTTLLNLAGGYGRTEQEEKAIKAVRKAYKMSWCTDVELFKMVHPVVSQFPAVDIWLT